MQLENEKRIEGKVVTPSWYRLEIISKVYRSHIYNIFLFSIDIFKLYLKSKDRFPCKLLKAIGALSFKRIKDDVKIIGLRAKELDNILKNYHIDNSLIDFNEYDIDNKINEFIVLYKNDLKIYEEIFTLYKEGYEREKDEPDFLGFAFYNVINDSFACLIDNNYDLFLDHLKLILQNFDNINNEIELSVSGYSPSNYKYKILVQAYGLVM